MKKIGSKWYNSTYIKNHHKYSKKINVKMNIIALIPRSTKNNVWSNYIKGLQLDIYLYSQFICQNPVSCITLHKIISEFIADRKTWVRPKKFVKIFWVFLCKNHKKGTTRLIPLITGGTELYLPSKWYGPIRVGSFLPI